MAYSNNWVKINEFFCPKQGVSKLWGSSCTMILNYKSSYIFNLKELFLLYEKHKIKIDIMKETMFKKIYRLLYRCFTETLRNLNIIWKIFTFYLTLTFVMGSIWPTFKLLKYLLLSLCFFFWFVFLLIWGHEFVDVLEKLYKFCLSWY